jgi:lipid-A-disaccharide synthase
MLAIHSLIQLHFPIYLLQSQQLVLAWRNLNIMGPRPWKRSTVICLLVILAIGATGLYASQALVLPPSSFAWIRSPKVHASSLDASLWLHLIGSLGIAAFSARFWIQWWEAEQRGESLLSSKFWWLSILGTFTAGMYFFLLSDWVNLIGPLCSLVPYSRNLCLLRHEKAGHCDIAIIAGEVSGDQLGASSVKALFANDPSLVICGVAGPSMRQNGVKPWFPMESFQVMGPIDIIKKAPFLLYALHRLTRTILDTKPSAVVFIDQPALSMRVAKKLRRKGYTGRIIQVVAPSVWAYRPERADLMASTFDLILPLFRFELDYFRRKLPATWIGHPSASLIKYRSDDPKTVLALFPGSRPAEVRRNLPLQLQSAAIILKEHPELSLAISVSESTSDLVTRTARHLCTGSYEIVQFSERYALMNRTKAAIAKSGTVTLELAMFHVPTVCCYQTGRFTQWWAQHMLHLRPQFFALPNILSGQEIVPECITPPVTPQHVANALRPYLIGQKSLPADIDDQLLHQIDSGATTGILITQAIQEILEGHR